MMRVMRAYSLGLALALIGGATAAARAGDSDLGFTDRFGRTINDVGLVLVDWEGYLANPALEFFLHPPAAATLPASVSITGNGVRLYLDAPSVVGAAGPGKVVGFTTPSPRAVKVSIFPDRDGVDEQYQLTFQYADVGGLNFSQTLDIHVIDQDLAESFEYNLIIDFSEDQSNFFNVAQRADIVQQVAKDWLYFIADMNLDVVPAGAQSHWIWNWPLAWTGPPPSGHWVTNSAAYQGFLLYAYGIDTPEIRSGGEPSTCCFHTSGGAPLTLRRSGGVEIEIKGNFNTLGWFLTSGDDDWWVSANLGGEPNDLYSIAHHEFGHALAFNSGYPGFATGEATTFDDPAVVAYHGSPVTVNRTFDHFEGVVDRLSARGIFGNEYGGTVPARRWLITKLDLLLLQAVGYPLRQTSSLVPLSVPAGALADGTVGAAYQDSIPAAGGVPFYDWVLKSGTLPPGLTLDRFTGTISGTPSAEGTYPFTVRVFEYDDGPGVPADRVITILPDPCPEDITGDGVVNVLDLIGLLLCFGQPAVPGCEAEDVNQDGTVNVLDLIELLLAFGTACP